MPEEQVPQQAAETQPEPQAQPAAQPEAPAQAAPAAAADPLAGEKLISTDPDGTVREIDLSEPEVAPEPQADGTPEAAAAEPAPAEDPVAAAEARVKEAQENLARERLLQRQAAQTFVPQVQPIQPPAFPQIDLSDMPDFEKGNFASDADAQKAMRQWTLEKIDQARIMGEAHARDIVAQQQQQLQQQAQQAQLQAFQQADTERRQASMAEAQRRSGLDAAQFQAKVAEARQNSIPAWYSGQTEDSLPVQYAGNVMDATAQARHAAGVPMAGYQTSADFLTELVADPGLSRSVANAFPRSQQSLLVLHSIAEGPNAVGRLKALTTTEEGQKVLGGLLAMPLGAAQHNRTAFEHLQQHIRAEASKFDAVPAPAAQPAAATNTPSVAAVATPTAAPPAITPTLRGGSSEPRKAEPEWGSRAWEDQLDADIAEHVRRTGTFPRVLH